MKLKLKWLVTPFEFRKSQFIILKENGYVLPLSAIKRLSEEEVEFKIRTFYHLFFFELFKVVWVTDKKGS